MKEYRNLIAFLIQHREKKQEPDKLDCETKLLETSKDGKWKKGATMIMGDQSCQDLENIKCPMEDP